MTTSSVCDSRGLQVHGEPARHLINNWTSRNIFRFLWDTSSTINPSTLPLSQTVTRKRDWVLKNTLLLSILTLIRWPLGAKLFRKYNKNNTQICKMSQFCPCDFIFLKKKLFIHFLFNFLKCVLNFCFIFYKIM